MSFRLQTTNYKLNIISYKIIMEVYYPIQKHLNKYNEFADYNDDDISFENYKNIYVCGYKINHEMHTPFIQYLLYNHAEHFDFLSIPYNKNINNSSFLSYLNIFLSGTLKMNISLSCKEVDGYIVYEDSIYFFVNITKYQ